MIRLSILFTVLFGGLWLSEEAAAAPESLSDAVSERTPVSGLTVVGWSKDSTQLLLLVERSNKTTAGSSVSVLDLVVLKVADQTEAKRFKGLCSSEVPLGDQGTASGSCQDNAEVEALLGSFVLVDDAYTMEKMYQKNSEIFFREGESQRLIATLCQLATGKLGKCDVYATITASPDGKWESYVMWTAKGCKGAKSSFKTAEHLFVRRR